MKRFVDSKVYRIPLEKEQPFLQSNPSAVKREDGSYEVSKNYTIPDEMVDKFLSEKPSAQPVEDTAVTPTQDYADLLKPIVPSEEPYEQTPVAKVAPAPVLTPAIEPSSAQAQPILAPSTILERQLKAQGKPMPQPVAPEQGVLAKGLTGFGNLINRALARATVDVAETKRSTMTSPTMFKRDYQTPGAVAFGELKGLPFYDKLVDAYNRGIDWTPEKQAQREQVAEATRTLFEGREKKSLEALKEKPYIKTPLGQAPDYSGDWKSDLKALSEETVDAVFSNASNLMLGMNPVTTPLAIYTMYTREAQGFKDQAKQKYPSLSWEEIDNAADAYAKASAIIEYFQTKGLVGATGKLGSRVARAMQKSPKLAQFLGRSLNTLGNILEEMSQQTLQNIIELKMVNDHNEQNPNNPLPVDTKILEGQGQSGRQAFLMSSALNLLGLGKYTVGKVRSTMQAESAVAKEGKDMVEAQGKSARYDTTDPLAVSALKADVLRLTPESQVKELETEGQNIGTVVDTLINRGADSPETVRVALSLLYPTTKQDGKPVVPRTFDQRMNDVDTFLAAVPEVRRQLGDKFDEKKILSQVQTYMKAQENLKKQAESEAKTQLTTAEMEQKEKSLSEIMTSAFGTGLSEEMQKTFHDELIKEPAESMKKKAEKLATNYTNYAQSLPEGQSPTAIGYAQWKTDYKAKHGKLPSDMAETVKTPTERITAKNQIVSTLNTEASDMGDTIKNRIANQSATEYSQGVPLDQTAGQRYIDLWNQWRESGRREQDLGSAEFTNRSADFRETEFFNRFVREQNEAELQAEQAEAEIEKTATTLAKERTAQEQQAAKEKARQDSELAKQAKAKAAEEARAKAIADKETQRTAIAKAKAEAETKRTAPIKAEIKRQLPINFPTLSKTMNEADQDAISDHMARRNISGKKATALITEFSAYKKDNPQGTFDDFQTIKAQPKVDIGKEAVVPTVEEAKPTVVETKPTEVTPVVKAKPIAEVVTPKGETVATPKTEVAKLTTPKAKGKTKINLKTGKKVTEVAQPVSTTPTATKPMPQTSTTEVAGETKVAPKSGVVETSKQGVANAVQEPSTTQTVQLEGETQRNKPSGVEQGKQGVETTGEVSKEGVQDVATPTLEQRLADAKNRLAMASDETKASWHKAVASLEKKIAEQKSQQERGQTPYGERSTPRTDGEITKEFETAFSKSGGKRLSTRLIGEVDGQTPLFVWTSDDRKVIVIGVKGTATGTNEKGLRVRKGGVTRARPDGKGHEIVTMTIDPLTSDETTIPHEMYEVLTVLASYRARQGDIKFIKDANKVLQTVNPDIDLTTAEGGHAFAVQGETPEGRKALADALRKANPTAREGVRGWLRDVFETMGKLIPSKFKKTKAEWAWAWKSDRDAFADGLEDFSALRLLANPSTLEDLMPKKRGMTAGEEPDKVAPKGETQERGQDPTYIPPAKDADSTTYLANPDPIRKTIVNEAIDEIERDVKAKNIKPIWRDQTDTMTERFKTGTETYWLRMKPTNDMFNRFGDAVKSRTHSPMLKAYNQFVDHETRVLHSILEAFRSVTDENGKPIIDEKALKRMQKWAMWRQTFGPRRETMEDRARRIYKRNPEKLNKILAEYAGATVSERELEAIRKVQGILESEVFPKIQEAHRLVYGEDLQLDLTQGEYGWLPYVAEYGEYDALINDPLEAGDSMQSVLQSAGLSTMQSPNAAMRKAQAEETRKGGAMAMPVDSMLDGLERFVRNGLYAAYINPEVKRWADMMKEQDTEGNNRLEQALGNGGVSLINEFYDVMLHNGGFSNPNKDWKGARMAIRNITGSQLSTSLGAILVQIDPVLLGAGVNDVDAQAKAFGLVMSDQRTRDWIEKASTAVRNRYGNLEEKRSEVMFAKGITNLPKRMVEHGLAPMLFMDKFGFSVNFLGAYITELNKRGIKFDPNMEIDPEIVAQAEETAIQTSGSARVVDKPLMLTTGITNIPALDKSKWLTKLLTAYQTPTFFNQALILKKMLSGDKKMKMALAYAVAAFYQAMIREITRLYYGRERNVDKEGRLGGYWLSRRLQAAGVKGQTARETGYWAQQWLNTMPTYLALSGPLNVYQKGKYGMPITSFWTNVGENITRLGQSIYNKDLKGVELESAIMAANAAQVMKGIPGSAMARMKLREEAKKHYDKREKMSLGTLSMGGESIKK